MQLLIVLSQIFFYAVILVFLFLILKKPHLFKNTLAHAKKFEVLIYIIFLLVSFSFLIGGIFLAYTNKSEEFLHAKLIPLFVSELGVAGIIAIILIATIETFTRKRHAKDTDEMHEKIYRNVFNAVFKRNINEKIFKEVEISLFDFPVERNNFLVDYSLYPISGSNEHLTVNIKSKYTLIHTRPGTTTHIIRSVLEMPIDSGLKDKVIFNKLKISRAYKDDLILEHQELVDKHMTKVDAKGEQLVLNYPIEISNHETIDIEIEGTLIKRTTDMEVWSSNIPSDGIEFFTRVPEGIKLSAKANHSSDLEEDKINSHMCTYENACRWKLDHGLFPHQSIVLWWGEEKNSELGITEDSLEKPANNSEEKQVKKQNKAK